MDETILKIATAALMHDIGKFAERASMPVSESYVTNNADLYQPYYNNRHSHKHALYTAAFIEEHAGILPDEFNAQSWGDLDSFINLAAGHHKPDTPAQWIVTIADWVSSGLDRADFKDDSEGVSFRDYKKTRLISLLEGVTFDGKDSDDSLESYQLRYPLAAISPESIFPVPAAEARENADAGYTALFEDFLEKLGRVLHRDRVELWIEHFESLLCAYTSHIPAATVKKVVPDVSLYDHCKTTAALAAALYLYHAQTGTLAVERVRDYDEKKLLLINGDFYGIQNFIFSQGGQTAKASAKLLRGRSFSVSLITELAADLLCRMTGLPGMCAVLNAAGKFTIIAANTENVKNQIRAVEHRINTWLHERYYSQCAFGISYVDAACGDFVDNKFTALWERLAAAAERKKLSRFSLDTFGGKVSGYLDSFNNELKSPLCPFCGKRPASAAVQGDYLLKGADSACAVCRDHIYLGTRLATADRIAIGEKNMPFKKGQHLSDPIFDHYQVSLDVGADPAEATAAGQLYKYWDISIPDGSDQYAGISMKRLNGYVPAYGPEDSSDESLDRLLHGKKSEGHKEELLDSIRQQAPKTFLHIAKHALNLQPGGGYCGVEALGVLKADVDNLGAIFGSGIRRPTISRMATLSRQLNNFFTLYLPHLLATEAPYRNVYTVFAGGDDLFLIGPWNRIVELSARIRAEFNRYACENQQVTISAGISMNRPGEPVFLLAERSEEALNTAKHKGKNAAVIFGEHVPWDKFDDLEQVRHTLQRWVEAKYLTHSLLYRFNDFARLAGEEKYLRDNQEDALQDFESWHCLKWRSMFRYNLARNVGKGLTSDDRAAAVAEVEQAAAWFDTYGSAVKVPLWRILYNNR